jgi:hypothetical protein
MSTALRVVPGEALLAPLEHDSHQRGVVLPGQPTGVTLVAQGAQPCADGRHLVVGERRRWGGTDLPDVHRMASIRRPAGLASVFDSPDGDL